MASPVRFAIIRKKLEAAGYQLARIRGAHHIFDRPGGPLVSIPVHNNLVKPFYVRQIEKIIAADKEQRAGEQKGRGSGSPKSNEGDQSQGH